MLLYSIYAYKRSRGINGLPAGLAHWEILGGDLCALSDLLLSKWIPHVSSDKRQSCDPKQLRYFVFVADRVTEFANGLFVC